MRPDCRPCVDCGGTGWILPCAKSVSRADEPACGGASPNLIVDSNYGMDISMRQLNQRLAGIAHPNRPGSVPLSFCFVQERVP